MGPTILKSIKIGHSAAIRNTIKGIKTPMPSTLRMMSPITLQNTEILIRKTIRHRLSYGSDQIDQTAVDEDYALQSKGKSKPFS